MTTNADNLVPLPVEEGWVLEELAGLRRKLQEAEASAKTIADRIDSNKEWSEFSGWLAELLDIIEMASTEVQETIDDDGVGPNDDR